MWRREPDSSQFRLPDRRGTLLRLMRSFPAPLRTVCDKSATAGCAWEFLSGGKVGHPTERRTSSGESKERMFENIRR